MRILLVEDDRMIAAAVMQALKDAAYAVDWVGDGVTAAAALETGEYQLVILDLGLPGRDGLEVLERMRLAGDRTAVLIVTARDGLEDRIRGLDLGADDYLVKPFDFDELNSRVQALMRRTLDAPTTILGAEGVELDTAKRIARVNGSPVELTPKEQALLEILLRRRGSVQSRGMLFEHLYDSRSATADKVIEVLVSTLRAKLNKAGAGQLIETRRGFGYLIR